MILYCAKNLLIRAGESRKFEFIRISSFVCFLSFFLTSCTSNFPQPSFPEEGLKSIQNNHVSGHIQRLSSDDFKGRLPGSDGELMTMKYLETQFRGVGLVAGNSDGSYFQQVPLVGITAKHQTKLRFSNKRQSLKLQYEKDFVGWSRRLVEKSVLRESEVVFVGYGVQAPEFKWDDFKGEDLRGKTLIMLVNDPPVTHPSEPAKLDSSIFGGEAMTYYGRWTYKYEMAAQKGAAGCFIIHEAEPAGYPWEVVRGSWSGEQFDLIVPDQDRSHCAVEGWLTRAAAERLLGLTGRSLKDLKAAAIRPDFRPVNLDVKAFASVQNSFRTINSNNVIAKLEGSDPLVKDEYVMYVAHWDHLGEDSSLEGDTIYNGAIDNATGIAGLLEIAAAFAQLEVPPRRSLLFLAVTAEEQGLLGSRYYAENPIYPLEKTLAALNMDAMNIWGPTHDITVVGMGNSTLEDLLEKVAMDAGRVVRPDPEPEKGYFYRSDHFSFAKVGVPSLYCEPGVSYINRPKRWGLERREEYIKNYYHKPSDEFDPNWNLIGLVEDLRLLFEVGYRVANQKHYPEWKVGTEFKSRREKMLKMMSEN